VDGPILLKSWEQNGLVGISSKERHVLLLTLPFDKLSPSLYSLRLMLLVKRGVLATLPKEAL